MTKLEGMTLVRDGTKLDVYFSRYGNNRTAIQLVERESGEAYSRLTVNMPEVDLGPDEVLIKNYSECVGNLEAAVAAGLIEDTGKTVEAGYAVVNVAKLLKKPAQY